MNDKPSTHPDDRPGAVTLVCTKCTRLGQFQGQTREQANMRAYHKGWRVRPGGVTICPQCPGGGTK